ncbi:MAG: phage holin family protein [Armatimonadota bacterium]
MVEFFARWIVSAVSLIVTVRLGIMLHLGMSLSQNFWGVMLAAAVFALINCSIGPLIRLFALPLSCLTLGLINLPINAFLFWLAGWLSPDFEVDGFVAAMVGSIIMSLVNSSLQNFTSSALVRRG